MSPSSLAPIVVTVYDRLSHLRACVESLKRSDLSIESDLYIFSDAASQPAHGPRIQAVRDYIAGIEGFKNVVPVLRERNMGAHASTSEAFSRILEIADSFIFLEDDIVVSRHFLRYMNDGLAFYRDDSRILGICSYTLPMRFPVWYRKDLYLGRRFSPWGFGMWRDRWEGMDLSARDRFAEARKNDALERAMESVGADYRGLLQMDSDGGIAAIDVRICYHQLVSNLYCIFPRRSLSTNTGFDGSGMHCPASARFDSRLDERAGYRIRWYPHLRPSAEILRRFKYYQDDRDYGLAAIVRKLTRKARKFLLLVLGAARAKND